MKKKVFILLLAAPLFCQSQVRLSRDSATGKIKSLPYKPTPGDYKIDSLLAAWRLKALLEYQAKTDLLRKIKASGL